VFHPGFLMLVLSSVNKGSLQMKDSSIETSIPTEIYFNVLPTPFVYLSEEKQKLTEFYS
jgi:hypothetical protein